MSARGSAADPAYLGPRILTYHRIDARPELGINTISPRRFEAHLQLLRDRGFVGLTLADVEQIVAGRRAAPSRSVHLTFDDAYACVAENAIAQCREQGFPVTIFVISGYVGRENRWDHTFPRARHLGWPALRALVGSGVAVGAHTISHPFLTRLTPARAHEEIAGSKKALEDRLGISVEVFAYPYGDVSPAVAAAVAEAGYRLAFTTRPDTRISWESRFLLPRTGVYTTDGARSLLAKLGCRGERAWRRSCRWNRWIHRCAYANLLIPF